MAPQQPDNRASRRRAALVALALLAACGAPVAATLQDLRAERSVPESLFAEDRELNTLSAAMDSINRKFGRQALVLGGMHTSRDSAPDRIAFHVIPALEPDR